MMKRTANHQGFSLLEVMIALAIFSISIVGLYSIQTMTISHNYVSSRITTAITWATEKLEELMALKYDDVTTDTVGEESPDGVYTVKWNVDEDTPLPNTKTVRVIVTTERKGSGSTVELEFIKHKG